jgi:8-oxo-dGTP pyrophosphatase MutT (NUDIX family)
MSDIHALIREFLQHHTVEPNTGDNADAESYTKAGVIPFQTDPLVFYVMKPKGMIPGLGEPLFQLCKGTRQYHVPGVGWRDIRDEVGKTAPRKEKLVETALREGVEELGLKLGNIRRIIDMGGYGFTSATTGHGKKMWLFAAEVKNYADFLQAADIAATTSERKWLDTEEFAVVGREDHRYILEDFATRLTPNR